ncbi:MAG: hypothetical protein J6Y38_08410 [Bacteroidaceae bacterium]|nr:hypothetical protein [Bacteroidaceae bacterium]
MKRYLKNHKLINFLADHSKIEMVSVSKTRVIATLSAKFTPDDVKPLCDAIGQWPVPRRNGGKNFIIFERFPNFEKQAQA